MDLTVLYEAVGTLGMPVAIAIFLIWHFVKVNKSLSEHNTRLLEELGNLREELRQSAESRQYHTRLLEQNEKLIEVLQQREQESLKMISRLVEVFFKRPGVHAEELG